MKYRRDCIIPQIGVVKIVIIEKASFQQSVTKGKILVIKISERNFLLTNGIRRESG